MGMFRWSNYIDDDYEEEALSKVITEDPEVIARREYLADRFNKFLEGLSDE